MIDLLFAGISNRSVNPDNGLAVGSGFIVMAEGSQVAWTDLAGGGATTMSLYAFFSPLGTLATMRLFDAKCVYDAVNQRYIVMVCNIDRATGTSTINIAVSKDADPSHGWYFGSIDTWVMIDGLATSADRPHIAVDGDYIYVTAPQYKVTASGLAGTGVYVIPTSDGAGGGFYHGDPLTVGASTIIPPSTGIFAVATDAGETSFLASTFNSGGGRISLAVQTFDETSNSFGPARVLPLGWIDQGGAYTAQQFGTSLLLDAGDKRIWDLEYAGGFLYGVLELKPIGSAVPLVHWFKLDVRNPDAPLLVASGAISGQSLGDNVATFNGSIAVNAAGQVLINFTASGAGMNPALYYMLSDDIDAATWHDPVLVRASSGYFDSGDGRSVQRWGDYSSAIVDPNDPWSFWISGEYVDAGWWQTAVARIEIAAPPVEVPDVPVILGMSNDNGASNADRLTNDTTPGFAVAAAPGLILDLWRDGVAVATATENAPGSYWVTAPALPDGTFGFTVAVRGDSALVSTTWLVTIDTRVSPVLIEAAARASDGTTFSGTADPGTTVQLFDGGTLLASALADAAGNWSAKSAYLKDVVRIVTAVASDPAGNSRSGPGIAIIGSTKADTALIGGVANDVVLGHGGDDVLDGGIGGDDRLTGGAGNDRFIFHGAFGTDLVTDYKDGRDKFDLDAGLGFGDLAITASDLDGDGNADDALIAVGGQAIHVLNIAVTALTPTDFLF